MTEAPQALLVGAVAAVGVLHTIVPDHWVPITLIARQRAWSKRETARASLQAGLGHVVSTLLIAAVVWLAGVAFATRFGHWVDTAASVALVVFGGWIAISSWRELSTGNGHHGHAHIHDVTHLAGGGIHGPELQRIPTAEGELLLSIFEAGVPPRFRVTGPHADAIRVETLRPDGTRQLFLFTQHGMWWESDEPIPEPHGFNVSITLEHAGHAHRYQTAFAEHEHDHHHDHEDHDGVHDDRRAHAQRGGTRTALLLILGSSPMVEGIPAFFAASRFGPVLIVVMSLVFATSTIATYVLLCVFSTASLQHVRLGAFERYGEVLSGAFIALVGIAFWVWPVL